MTIKLGNEDIKLADRRSSKGNQLKFERDGIWYKADYTGYEGLAEYVISRLLGFSDLNNDEYVEYKPVAIEYNDAVFNGCESRDFSNGWQMITLERLFKQTYGYGLNKIIYSTSDHTERLKLMVDKVIEMTGLEEFGTYISKMLTIDALFLNEDRHTHNIAILTRGRKEYRLCPIFDNGAGLLSDTTMDYPIGKDVISLIDKVKAATFCDSFYEQLEIAEKLYGNNIRFSFGYPDVEQIVNSADIYSDNIRLRVIDTIMEMRRRYIYLFER